MKNLILLCILGVSLSACDKAKYGRTAGNTGPTPEVLREELQNAPMAPEAENKVNTLTLPQGDYSKLCYNPDQIQDARQLGYELVVVIDKAADGQTFKVYRNGELIGDWKTSTGLEHTEYKKTTSGSRSRMITEVGFYTPIKGRLYGGFDKNGEEIVYESRTWIDPETGKKVKMPNAIFFNEGIAIHETKAVAFLGTRASGGCVRLHGDVAGDFFNLVKFEVGKGPTVALDENGCVKADSKGQPEIVNGYRTLIVVRDSSK